jgi:hypothetical protein
MPSMQGPILALLTILFALRVLGQALAAFFAVSWLPSMEQWFSGLIPYSVLLGIQLVMLIVMVKISSQIWRRAGFFAVRRPHWAQFLIKLSALYAAIMALRYVLTMLLRPEMRWSGGAIPIVFHFVLAGFIYAWGNYYSGKH